MSPLIPIAMLALAVGSSEPQRAERVLITQTGAQIQCSELNDVRFRDMPRLFGINNFDREYESYLRFRAFAPRDCSRPPRIGHSGAVVAIAY